MVIFAPTCRRVSSDSRALRVLQSHVRQQQQQQQQDSCRLFAEMPGLPTRGLPTEGGVLQPQLCKNLNNNNNNNNNNKQKQKSLRHSFTCGFSLGTIMAEAAARPEQKPLRKQHQQQQPLQKQHRQQLQQHQQLQQIHQLQQHHQQLQQHHKKQHQQQLQQHSQYGHVKMLKCLRK